MKRLILATLSAILISGFGFGLAQAADAPKEPVKIETAGGKKPPVLFEHSKHADQKCETCHHTHNNEANEHRCVKCHKLADDEATKAPKIDTAMHGKDKGVCFKCHKAEDAVHKLKCADCHKG
jgi:hypothetical protein